MTADTSKLSEYRRKRDPARTKEPFESGPEGGDEPIFVVQRHAARRLHYDLRLERNGALASWAVPKGLPMDRGSRRLAVHVEDHPLSYASFEGEIPKGEYGAGTVEIWDRGKYELLEEKRDGGLTFRLRGERLQGIWTLVPAAMDGDEKNWLLLRKSDDRGPGADLPRYEPMLSTLAAEVPTGKGWLYEIKWDGYRTIARVHEGDASLVSRTGKDQTAGRFEPIARALPRALRSPECVVDGEICALDAQGRPRFSEMQRGTGALVLYLFDLLELDGEPLLDKPFVERHERLRALVVTGQTGVRVSEVFEDGPALFEAAGKQGLEGIVAKRASSTYQPGKRTQDWVKIKVHQLQEFVIAGYTRGAGRRAGTLGALVLGVWDGDELVWAGNCGTGFSDADIDRPHEKAPAARAEDVAVQHGSADAAGSQAGRRLGEALSRLPGRVRRVDGRGTAARPVVSGVARRQARNGGAPRTPAGGGDRARLPQASRPQPGQDVLAG